MSNNLITGTGVGTSAVGLQGQQQSSTISTNDVLKTVEKVSSLAVDAIKEIYGQKNPANQPTVTTGTSATTTSKSGVSVQVTN
jgi:hypothetical protein